MILKLRHAMARQRGEGGRFHSGQESLGNSQKQLDSKCQNI